MNHIFYAVSIHACLTALSVQAQNIPLTPLTQPHKHIHIHSYAQTHKRGCAENVENHNENLNLRKEQPASTWG